MTSVSQSEKFYAERLKRNREWKTYQRQQGTNNSFVLSEKASRRRWKQKQRHLNKLAVLFVKDNRRAFEAWVEEHKRIHGAALSQRFAPRSRTLPVFIEDGIRPFDALIKAQQTPQRLISVQRRMPRPPDPTSSNPLEQIGFQ